MRRPPSHATTAPGRWRQAWPCILIGLVPQAIGSARWESVGDWVVMEPVEMFDSTLTGTDRQAGQRLTITVEPAHTKPAPPTSSPTRRQPWSSRICRGRTRCAVTAAVVAAHDAIGPDVRPQPSLNPAHMGAAQARLANQGMALRVARTFRDGRSCADMPAARARPVLFCRVPHLCLMWATPARADVRMADQGRHDAAACQSRPG
jgi:hypothetical protein